jgi:hypothetical protein
MKVLKVEGYDNLVRDVKSNGIINISKSEYKMYMARVSAREQQGDEIRNTVKEINNLKAELREIKNLLKEVIRKNNGI